MLAECIKCGSSKEIKLKIDGDQMIPVCVECGTPQALSRVMINTMKSNKDIILGSSEEHVPFGFPCQKCNKTQEMVYDRKSHSAKCSVCGATGNVSPFMLRSLELTGHVKRSSENAERYDGGNASEGEDTVGTTGKGKIKRKG